MAGGQFLFTLDYEQFTEDWSQEILFKLQQEFDTKTNFSLSQSLLISQETEGTYWMLVDFENQKTYDIKKENDTTVEVSDGVDLRKYTDILSDAGTIVPRLQEGIGTHRGIIDALKRLNFNTVSLENLKRSSLSPNKLSFESVYPDLEVAYEMLREILASPRTALISLPSRDVRQLEDHILKSYEMTRKIMDFGVGGRNENIRVRHSEILQEIHQFCDAVKRSLSQAAAYLSSRKIEELVKQVNTTLTDAEEKFNTAIDTETEKLQKLGVEAEQQTSEIVEKLEQTHLKYQNQLTEKPISQYKTTFNDQAKKHGKMSWIWLWTTVGLTVVSAGIFWWVLKDLVPAANDLPTVLPNLLAKGFFLSLIYLLLNRSIKNYTAEKHLEVINIHRQNALETVDPFLDATKENSETRDQILLAATKTIYDANQSGYLSTKTSGSDSASPVQQIIKEVIPSKSSGKDD